MSSRAYKPLTSWKMVKLKLLNTTVGTLVQEKLIATLASLLEYQLYKLKEKCLQRETPLYVRYPENLKLGKYDPYGSPGSGKNRFRFAGVIVGLFGQSSKQLDVIGFDIDTTPYSPALPYYDKASVVRVDIGELFDDEVESLSPVRINTW